LLQLEYKALKQGQRSEHLLLEILLSLLKLTNEEFEQQEHRLMLGTALEQVSLLLSASI